MQHSAELQQRFDKSISAFDFARHYARYAHRDYLVWPMRSQQWRAVRVSMDAAKAMLLDIGTQGHGYLIDGSGTGMIVDWWIGLNLFRQSHRAAGRLSEPYCLKGDTHEKGDVF